MVDADLARLGNLLRMALDDPYLPSPIQANLIEPDEQDGKMILIWNRD